MSYFRLEDFFRPFETCPGIRNAHRLEVHEKRDAPIGENKMKCMLCDKVIKKGTIASHRQAHTSAKNDHCSLCHIEFNPNRVGLLDVA